MLNASWKTSWKKGVGALGVASALLLGACASQDAVQHAQATADQALQSAQAANQKAEAATAAANAANARADRMYQQNLRK